MIRYEDMLIDTPYKLSEVENRTLKPGHPTENRCSYCKGQGNLTWYPVEDITVIRRWTASSVYWPDRGAQDSGGWYSWRCPNHPFDGRPSPWLDQAPLHLRPKYTHRCRQVELGKACGEIAIGQWDNSWLCERHARPIILRERLEALLRDDVDTVDDPNDVTDVQ
ncbi:hypothetical protein [Microbacterium sp. AR7-10]|uniref:hypothetical protein n=1 Tax=Microbacterium sp. AR7-10 TaxID=1891970 RepID=UPI0008FCD74C|nr:hypothetical protein [Microbacterium sp. AR7-10]OIU87849.1 hypothetical protein BFN01_07285 [Microbacterium sp. AR7-10]